MKPVETSFVYVTPLSSIGQNIEYSNMFYEKYLINKM